MLFFNIWFFFMITGILFAIGLFVWAVKNRQFEEQNRLRFLPLKDLDDTKKFEKPEKSLRDTIPFIIIITIGLSVISFVVVLSIIN